MFLAFFYASETFSEIKKEIIRFSSETAQFKKKDGVLYLSGDVKISYREYLIKSDFLTAKTNDVGSQEIKVIEAERNIYFSNKNFHENIKFNSPTEKNLRLFNRILKGKTKFKDNFFIYILRKNLILNYSL